MTPSIFGILLAGGHARRMGGGDKGLQSIGGQSIISRIVTILEPQCAGLILNANGDISRLTGFGLPVIPDDVPDFAGPLAGILAGLDWIAVHHPEIALAVSVPTDTPFLPGNLVAHLHEAKIEAGAEIAVASSGGSRHPVVAVWPVAIRQNLRHALVEKHIRKMGAFIEQYKTAYAEWPVAPYDPFFNANEPQDIAAAEKIWAAQLRG